MNPKHPEFLKSALSKFGILSFSQVNELFREQISLRTIERCLHTLVQSHEVVSNYNSLFPETLYTPLRSAMIAIPDHPLSTCYSLAPAELGHRLRCIDVCLSLARRSYIAQVLSEYEIDRWSIPVPVSGRKPDGLFRLERGDRAPIDVALEVETTLRNQKRIADVIRAYVATFDEDPNQLSGVLIVANRPEIARAYRTALDQIAQKYPRRFVLSEHLDLRDVKETLLGWTVYPLSEHPKKPLTLWAAVRRSDSIKSSWSESADL